MIIQETIPLNSIAWTIGIPGALVFAIKTALFYHHQHNPLAGAYAAVFSLMTISFAFFGLPGWFTQDNSALTLCYYFADFFLMASFIPQAYLLWFIGLKSRVRLRYVLLVTLILISAILTFDIMSSRVTYGPEVIVVHDPAISLWLKNILFLALPWPIAYFMIRVGLAEKALSGRVKSICIGLTYIAFSAAGVANNLFTNGSDTIATSTGNIFLFLIFFVITVWPKSTQLIIKR